MGYEYGGDYIDYERAREPLTGRLSNGLFYQHTGQEYGYDLASREEEDRQRALNEAAKNQRAQAAYQADIEMRDAPEKNAQALDLYRGKQEIDAQYREPSLESFLFGGIKPFEQVQEAGPPLEGQQMPTHMQMTPEGRSALSMFAKAKSPNYSRSAAELESWGNMAPEDRAQYESLVVKYGGQIPGGVRINRPALAPEVDAQLDTNSKAAQLQAGPGKAFGPQAARDLLTSNSLALGGGSPEPTQVSVTPTGGKTVILNGKQVNMSQADYDAYKNGDNATRAAIKQRYQ
jgi:hypothetical protein